MGALFPTWTNTFSRVVLFGLFASVVGFFAFLLLWVRSPLFTNQESQIVQPVQFDHRHHVADDGIDCRYCHDAVDRGPSAGIPSSSLCMNCHERHQLSVISYW